jgi:hypothetical protein
VAGHDDVDVSVAARCSKGNVETPVLVARAMANSIAIKQIQGNRRRTHQTPVATCEYR